MVSIADRLKELRSAQVKTVEVAAKRKNFRKMIDKIVAISQNMKLTEKDWDKIDAGVRKGLGAEKASVETANAKKYTVKKIKGLLKPKPGANEITDVTYKDIIEDNMDDMDLARLTKLVKGDSPEHFWVQYDGDIVGAIYQHNDKWYVFCNNVNPNIGVDVLSSKKDAAYITVIENFA